VEFEIEGRVRNTSGDSIRREMEKNGRWKALSLKWYNQALGYDMSTS
jgi:hypothetical protein